MPKKKAKKKTVHTRAAKKTAVKKSAGTKTVRKKAVKKKAAKKKATKKKARGKAAAKAMTATAAVPSKTVMVAPGPQPTGIPPVEEPAAHEEAVGTVTHYYTHLSVAVVQINKGELRTGDTIHIKGHTTDFTQTIQSMEYEHQHVDVAQAGQSVGIKVIDHAREHDIVYLVR